MNEHWLAERVVQVSRLCAWLAVALGLTVLLGWAAELPLLKSLHPSWVSMKPNTALGFVLGGLAVHWSAPAPPTGGWKSWARVGVAGLLLGLALATGYQYLSGADLGLDQLLFSEPPGTPGTVAPGRMALNTVLCFAVVGLSVLLLDWEVRGQRPAQWLAAAVGALALQGLSVYLYRANFEVGIGSYTLMALHTTLGFLLLSGALLFSRADRGWMALVSGPHAGGTMARRLLPMVLAIPVALGGLSRWGEHLGAWDSGYGAALFGALSAVALVAVVTWTARPLAQADLALRQAMHQARSNEERLRITLSSIAEAVVASDLEGRVVDLNPVASALTGWTLAAARGQPVTVVVPLVDPEPGAETPDPTARVLSGQTGLDRGDRLLLAAGDGPARPVAHSCTPIRDAFGAVQGAVLVLADQTEDRRAKARLAESERLASVGTLASGVAHEINNPLTFVISNLSFLVEQLSHLRAGLAPNAHLDLSATLIEMEEAFADARVGAERVRLIVRDLKTLARPDDRARGPVEVNAALSGALRIAAHELRHRARVEQELGPVPRVLAGDGQLGQVFLNLLMNAAQAIPPGHADRNRVGIRCYTDAGGGAVVEVSDTGGGIAPAVLSRIFEPFFTTRSVGEGTGLGLSICRGILSSLGGSISVESHPGKGSTFRVWLPACPEPEPASQAALPEAILPQRRSRVLVIDDEGAICAAVRRGLEELHEVVTLTDATVALDRLASGERFDLILCDVLMPVCSGEEFHRKLAALDPQLAAGVLFMSGGSLAGSEGFLQSVAERSIEKPFELDVLRQRVARQLAANRGR